MSSSNRMLRIQRENTDLQAAWSPSAQRFHLVAWKETHKAQLLNKKMHNVVGGQYMSSKCRLVDS